MSEPIERICDQLQWRDLNDKPLGHVVLRRAEALELLQWINQKNGDLSQDMRDMMLQALDE